MNTSQTPIMENGHYRVKTDGIYSLLQLMNAGVEFHGDGFRVGGIRIDASWTPAGYHVNRITVGRKGLGSTNDRYTWIKNNKVVDIESPLFSELDDIGWKVNDDGQAPKETTTP